MHLKMTSEIVFCGCFFPEASGVGRKQGSLPPVFRGHRLSCSRVCPHGPGAIFCSQRSLKVLTEPALIG